MSDEVHPFTAAVVNLGCRVNRVEADSMEADLESHGAVLTEPSDARVIVVNTCAVTGMAEKKTRKMVRRMHDLPHAPDVLVAGCASNLSPEVYAALGERVIVLEDKSDVASRALDLIGGIPTIEHPSSGGSTLTSSTSYHGRSRLGVMIQDGCDNRCTYCVVWKARGPARSMDAGAVIKDVVNAFDSGIPEIVLTGIDLGNFSGTFEGERIDLAALMKRILAMTDRGRLRLSSIEPPSITDELIELMALEPDRICPHLHLPLQSGSDTILAAMGRRYDTADFLNLVIRLRQAVPSIALTTDIIVGFPGEKEVDHESTLRISKDAAFSRIHVFKFSPREATPAAEMNDQVTQRIVDQRAAELRELSDRLLRTDAERRVGTTEFVVMEADDRGTTGSYHTALLAPDEELLEPGMMVRMEFSHVDPAGILHGRVVRSIEGAAGLL